MLGHLFNRQHRPTHHSTVTALQGCLRYPHCRSLSLQSCPDCSPGCPLMFWSFLTTLPYMMAGIHLDMQLYKKGCVFLKEVWQARSAWNILDCLILLLLLRKKILKVFRACEGGRLFVPNCQKITCNSLLITLCINLLLGLIRYKRLLTFSHSVKFFLQSNT